MRTPRLATYVVGAHAAGDPSQEEVVTVQGIGPISNVADTAGSVVVMVPTGGIRTSAPAVGAQATVTFAAVPGKRWVIRTVIASMQATAAAVAPSLYVRMNTVVLSRAAFPSSAIGTSIVLPFININCTFGIAEAVAVEFNAGLANLTQTIYAEGYTI